MRQLKLLWQNPRRLIKIVIVSAIALLGLQGLNLWAGSGQVIDAETGKPLAGVFVLALWHGSGIGIVDSRTVCYHFAIAQTNERGEYSLPEFSWNFSPFLSNRGNGKNYYLAGYETASDEVLNASVVKMRRYSGTAEKRLETMKGPHHADCGSESDRKKLVPLYRAQYEEAQRIAQTPKEKGMAESYRQHVIYSELGHEAYVKFLMQESKR